jgi:hypothetical protein
MQNLKKFYQSPCGYISLLVSTDILIFLNSKRVHQFLSPCPWWLSVLEDCSPSYLLKKLWYLIQPCEISPPLKHFCSQPSLMHSQTSVSLNLCCLRMEFITYNMVFLEKGMVNYCQNVLLKTLFRLGTFLWFRSRNFFSGMLFTVTKLKIAS